jgi:hypothetical protein
VCGTNTAAGCAFQDNAEPWRARRRRALPIQFAYPGGVIGLSKGAPAVFVPERRPPTPTRASSRASRIGPVAENGLRRGDWNPATAATLVGMARTPDDDFEATRAAVGVEVRTLFSDILRQPLPADMADLLGRLDQPMEAASTGTTLNTAGEEADPAKAYRDKPSNQ